VSTRPSGGTSRHPRPTTRSQPRSGSTPGDICLVACHVWDTIGAQAAGWQAGLILRQGNAPLGVGPQPDYTGKNLDDIADQLIGKYGSATGQ